MPITAALRRDANTAGLRLVEKPDGLMQIQWPEHGWLLNVDLDLGVRPEPGWAGPTIAGPFKTNREAFDAVVASSAYRELNPERTQRPREALQINPTVRGIDNGNPHKMGRATAHSYLKKLAD